MKTISLSDDEIKALINAIDDHIYSLDQFIDDSYDGENVDTAIADRQWLTGLKAHLEA